MTAQSLWPSLDGYYVRINDGLRKSQTTRQAWRRSTPCGKLDTEGSTASLTLRTSSDAAAHYHEKQPTRAAKSETKSATCEPKMPTRIARHCLTPEGSNP
jgi:hypothetical protein